MARRCRKNFGKSVSAVEPKTMQASLIKKKNFIVWGGSYEERQGAVAELRDAFLRAFPSGRVFRLSEHLGDSDRFLKSAELELLGRQDRCGSRHNHMDDIFSCWPHGSHNALIIFPELDKMLKNDPEFCFTAMRLILGHKQQADAVVRFVMTFGRHKKMELSEMYEPYFARPDGSDTPSDKNTDVVTLAS